MTNPSEYPLTTTLDRIWACDPCKHGRDRALDAAGKLEPDDEPITYAEIDEAVGLDDALWCTQAEPRYAKEWRLFAIWCARRVQHFLSDQRSLDAIDVTERFVDGSATIEELKAAGISAQHATDDAIAAAVRLRTRTCPPGPVYLAWATVWAAQTAAMVTNEDAAEAAQTTSRGYLRATGPAAARAGIPVDSAKAAAVAAQRKAFCQVVTHGEILIPTHHPHQCA